MVVSRTPIVNGYCRDVLVRFVATSVDVFAFGAQVDEGETQIINIRETDGRLGPLVFTLVVLGCVALSSTAIFWWLTSPRRMRRAVDGGARSPEHTDRIQGDV